MQRREHTGADEERPLARPESRHERQEEQERGEGKDPEREVELRHVPEEPAEHLHEVVRLLAGGAVGAEEVERRAAAHELRDEDQHARAADGRVQPPPEPRRPALDGRERERREQDRGDEDDRLRARDEREADGAEEEERPRPASAARAPRRARARRAGTAGRTRSRSSASPRRAATAARRSARRPRGRPVCETTRRASRYAGTTASEIATALIAFAAVYAAGTESKSAHAGASRSG